MLKLFAAVAVTMTVGANVVLAQSTVPNALDIAPEPQISAPVAPNLEAPVLASSATASDLQITPFAETAEIAPDANGAQPTETAPIAPADLKDRAQGAYGKAFKFLKDGGPSIWAIAALAVITLALILWKIWRLALIGAWSRGKAGKALRAYEHGDYELALKTVRRRRGVRSKVLTAGLVAIDTLPEPRAREEVARIAKGQIATARIGLGALELISTIAPLLGLLGTVLGMIAAFQALQAAGSKADPALLAGGIWEALLTTAAGMGVAIPASAALTWFEAVIDRIRRDIEDGATRLFVAAEPVGVARLAAD